MCLHSYLYMAYEQNAHIYFSEGWSIPLNMIIYIST